MKSEFVNGVSFVLDGKSIYCTVFEAVTFQKRYMTESAAKAAWHTAVRKAKKYGKVDL